ncbi:MAG: YraN family protein [Odoribacteraceae bacterium]|jgi:putative endonuclease|nr:YraN family protein [Odoribacteraceae bacterium]
MARHNALGKLGEEQARRYLLDKGFSILEQNWRAGRLEVDFIAIDGAEIVVVEVKTRARPGDRPGELLSAAKCRRLMVAGELYVESRGIMMEIRFDLVVVSGGGKVVEHVRDAIRLHE